MVHHPVMVIVFFDDVAVLRIKNRHKKNPPLIAFASEEGGDT
jgi:hypothetical protein